MLPGLGLTISGIGRLYGGRTTGIVETARIAEQLGFEQVALPDHVLIGPRTDRYPFGKFPFDNAEPWPEPLTVLAAIAAVTSRIRLATSVLIAPARPSSVLAKTVATLDDLSGGRVDLGVGAGWQSEELLASRVDPATRFSVLEQSIATCRRLWTTTPATVSLGDSEQIDWWCVPAPVQQPLPVWIAGGPTVTTATRVARFGDGWLPLANIGDDELRDGIDDLRAAWEMAGRETTTWRVRAGVSPTTDPRVLVDRRDQLGEWGVTIASVTANRLGDNPNELHRQLESVSEAWHS